MFRVHIGIMGGGGIFLVRSYWCYIGMMEKKMETTIYIGLRV